MFRLGLTWADVLTMPYSRAAWYVKAAATEEKDEEKVGPREATQADIDAF